jgi:hypothetical protein
VVAHRHRVAEAGPAGDRIDGLVCLLEQLLSQQDPLTDEPALRCRAGVLNEPAGEGSLGHVRASGEIPHRDRL